MKEGECDSFACVNADLYGKQVFYCANNCTISLFIIQQIVTLSKYGHDALDICHP